MIIIGHEHTTAELARELASLNERAAYADDIRLPRRLYRAVSKTIAILEEYHRAALQAELMTAISDAAHGVLLTEAPDLEPCNRDRACYWIAYAVASRSNLRQAVKEELGGLVRPSSIGPISDKIAAEYPKEIRAAFKAGKLVCQIVTGKATGAGYDQGRAIADRTEDPHAAYCEARDEMLTAWEGVEFPSTQQATEQATQAA